MRPLVAHLTDGWRSLTVGPSRAFSTSHCLAKKSHFIVKHEEFVVPILHKSRHFIVVNKPSGIYTQINFDENAQAVRMRQEEGMYLLPLLRKQHPELYKNPKDYPFTEPKLVHRLDQYVSGAMIVATSQLAAQKLSRYLKHGGKKGMPFERHYAAVVRPSETSPLVSGNYSNQSEIIWDEGQEGKRGTIVTSDKNGRISRTLFHIRYRVGKNYLVTLELVEGRKHQLRKHCADILDAPVVGDHRYCKDEKLAEQWKVSSERRKLIGLHSYKLRMLGPKQGADVTVFAPIERGRQSVWKPFIDKDFKVIVDREEHKKAKLLKALEEEETTEDSEQDDDFMLEDEAVGESDLDHKPSKTSTVSTD
ncbi:pseudouridine synthase [Dipodascopsis tothii]|uniref:pseudouridine synthase n=1 Tax=Dipodascopsis tothii TaxID=44089 RepID=UPI0034CDD8C7